MPQRPMRLGTTVTSTRARAPGGRSSDDGSTDASSMLDASGRSPTARTRRVAAVSELALEHERTAARASPDAGRAGPHHLEPGRAQARDPDQRDRAPDRDGQEHGAPEGHDGRQPRGGAERHEAGAGDRHVERRPRRVELHVGSVRARACRGGS